MNYKIPICRKAVDQYAAPAGGDTADASSGNPKRQGLRPRARGAAGTFQLQAATDLPPCVDECMPGVREEDIRHDKP